MIACGDCLTKMRELDSGSVDVVYLDPPFFTQKKQTLKTRDNTKEYSFADKWTNLDAYRGYITARLHECKRVLKDTGSVFLHCDRSASHHLRMALDEVFGTHHFQSEIIWHYKRWSNSKNGLLNAHQVIYFYSKTGNFKFNKTFENYSPTTNLDQIFQKRERDPHGKTRYKKNSNGSCELMDGKSGVPLSDVWEIPYLNPKAEERTGYPTQKPVILLERIIQLVTDPEDVVLDPFCGSGTTLVAATLIGRNFIGIDISPDAVALSRKRLLAPFKTESALLKKGKAAFLNQDPHVLKLLDKLNAMPVQRNKGIDGFLKMGSTIKPIPVKIQRDEETLQNARESLTKATKKNGFLWGVLVTTHGKSDASLFECKTPVFPSVLVLNDIQNIAQVQDKVKMFVEIEATRKGQNLMDGG